MKALVMTWAVLVLATAASAVAASDEKPKEVHGAGCVQAGVEARCLVVKDIGSGTLYNLLIKEPRPAIGEGIEFTGAPFEGATYCMQGAPVRVTTWTKKPSLKCSRQ